MSNRVSGPKVQRNVGDARKTASAHPGSIMHDPGPKFRISFKYIVSLEQACKAVQRYWYDRAKLVLVDSLAIGEGGGITIANGRSRVPSSKSCAKYLGSLCAL